MATYSGLAQNLKKITGLEFEIEEDDIISTTPITPVGEYLMNNVADYTDLYIDHEGTKFRVPLDALTEEAGDAVQALAELEDERVNKLEEALPILIEKTGMPFVFDKSHRLLIAPNPVWENPLAYETKEGGIVMNMKELKRRKERQPHMDYDVLPSSDQLHRIQAVAYLDGAGAIEGNELHINTPASMIAIYDVNPAVLRMTAMPELETGNTIRVGEFDVPKPGTRQGPSSETTMGK